MCQIDREKLAVRQAISLFAREIPEFGCHGDHSLNQKAKTHSGGLFPGLLQWDANYGVSFFFPSFFK